MKMDSVFLERQMRNVACDVLIEVGVPEEIAEEIVEKMTEIQLAQFLIGLFDAEDDAG